MAISASELRADIYNILDRVLAGEEVEIERKGRRLRIVADPTVTGAKPPRRRLEDFLVSRDLIVGDPEDLVHIDWSAEWNPDRAIDP